MADDARSARAGQGGTDSEAAVATRPALRFIVCGSAADGKSTLIGRLLDEKSPLEAEREFGATTDVAYRNFSTPKRSFIVVDTRGHEHHTRNAVTAVSNADLAVILVDARTGLAKQTFQDAVIVSLLGLRHIVLAVNKIDLVGFDQAVFDRFAGDFGAFASKLHLGSLTAIPISARYGDNVSSRSARTPWYRGPDLLSCLEAIDAGRNRNGSPFRMIVQSFNRPNPDFHGFVGTIGGGSLRVGDEVEVSGSGRITRVKRIVTAAGDTDFVQVGDEVTLLLADEVGIARGDLLASPKHRPQVADQFAAHLIWMSDEHLLPGRSYLMKIGARTVPASVTELKYRLDVETLAHHAAKTLELDEIGFCNLSAASAVAFDPYVDNRETGAFVLVDRYTDATVAAGLIAFELRRASNIHYQDITISKEARAKLKAQRPVILWFTGLPAAGKSTIANLVETQLHARGVHTTMLDGDNVRHGLSKDLGFTDADRVENIRRVGEVAKLMTEAGLIVLCSFISPFRAERRMVRALMGEGDFIEIFVDTPLDECIARDPKGLYKRALAGEIKNFTGVDQSYETPEIAEIHLRTADAAAGLLARRIVEELLARKII